jgi:hypothetical protein
MDEIWVTEEQFWLGGADHYRTAMHPDCMMAFQAPAGILVGRQIIEAINRAPRWASVVMVDRRMTRPVPGVIALAYKAQATRGDDAPYDAYCTSTYVHGEDGWRLIQHQHSAARALS